VFFKELWLAIRRNFTLNLLAACLVFFSLILMFVTFFYIDSNRIGSISAGDEVAEGAQMALLVQDRENSHVGDEVEGLRRMYELMTVAEEFDTLMFRSDKIELGSSFVRNPYLSAAYLFGDTEMVWELDTEIVVRAINFGFLEHFPLNVSQGRTFEERDFENYSGYIPIILGSQFMPFYEIGERLDGTFYNYPFQFEVIGFLEAGHSGPDFNWSPDDWFYSMDEIGFIPFINFSQDGRGSSPQWESFLSHYYFHLMQPWIRFEDTREALDISFNLIASLSDYVGMPMFFTETHPILIRNAVTRNTIAMNLEAITTFMVAAFLLISVVLYYFSKVKYLRKQGIYRSLSLLGVSKYKQVGLILLENAVFLVPTIILVLYYLIYWSNLIVSWSAISDLFDKWEVIDWVLFDPMVNMAFPILWQLMIVGLAFYVIQNIYPIWKILSVYRGGKSDA